MKELIVYIIKNLITPLLVLFVGTHLWNWFLEKKREKRERYLKLYGQLALYSAFIHIIKKNTDEILEKSKIANQNLKSETPEHYRNIFGKKINEEMKLTNSLVRQWWQYVEKYREAFESNPQYVKKEDMPLVEEFIDGYIKRGLIGKESTSEAIPYLIIETDSYKEYSEKILNAVKKLTDRFRIKK